MHYPGLARAIIVGGAYRKLTPVLKKGFAAGMGMPGPGKVDFDWLEKHSAGFVAFCKTAHATADDPDHWKTLYLQLSACWYQPMNHTRADLQRATDPVLVLIGDRDDFVSVEDTAPLYRDLPKGELAVIPNGTPRRRGWPGQHL